jgi:levansucrase
MNDLASAITHDRQSVSRWTRDALSRLNGSAYVQAPLLRAEQACPMSPHLDVWDSWPLADATGQPLPWHDGELWFALAVTRSDDPETRHHLARIHHFHRKGNHFEHLGQTLPEEIAEGARQWSGSALFDDGIVTLYFTAAGYRGDTDLTYHQRLFSAQTVLADSDVFGAWSKPAEIVSADGLIYQPANQNKGEPGKIKAFRDPSHYRDASGKNYLLFTGSSAREPSMHDGMIGLAIADEKGTYHLLPPLIEALGVSNELERPHIVSKDGLLYLFWSTQRGVFAPEITAPTGLYGATAASLAGPWEMMNEHGLVLANPAERPTQAYSWWVLPDLTVASFVDYWGPEEPAKPELETRRARFGGTFAPFVTIELEGSTSRIVPMPE